MRQVTQKVDEDFAGAAIVGHFKLADRKVSAFIQSEDPPDLKVIVEGGAVWGVEVVRCYQSVPMIGKRTSSFSSDGLIARLEKFGSKIGTEISNFRKRPYVLFLQGDGIGSSWIPAARSHTLGQWERQTREQIVSHVRANLGGVLRGAGFELREGGKDWSVVTSPGVSAVVATLETAIRRAFHDKLGDIEKWSIDCTQRWLFILNGYPLAEDDEAREIVGALLSEQGSGFDGVFWHGASGSPLLAVAR